MACYPSSGVSAHSGRAQTCISAILQESYGSPQDWEYHLSESQVQTSHITNTKNLKLVFRGPEATEFLGIHTCLWVSGDCLPDLNGKKVLHHPQQYLSII